MRDDSPWYVEGLRLKNIRCRPTVRWKTEKMLTILATIFLIILSNTTKKNHYNFVVAQPLVKNKVTVLLRYFRHYIRVFTLYPHELIAKLKILYLRT